MTVGDGTTYDASFGIVTGFRWPLSGDLPEMIRNDLAESLAACRYSRLRHLLTSYPVHPYTLPD